MVDEIGPCDNCGRDAPYAGEMDGKPTYFCCACTLAIVGWVDPDCFCAVCEAERLRAQIAVPECDCKSCREFQTRATKH